MSRITHFQEVQNRNRVITRLTLIDFLFLIFNPTIYDDQPIAAGDASIVPL